MTNEELNEDPQRSTSGLTSARQVIDFTDSAIYSFAGTSSAVPEPILLPKGEILAKPEAAQGEMGMARALRFRIALRASLRRNSNVLEELSKR